MLDNLNNFRLKPLGFGSVHKNGRFPNGSEASNKMMTAQTETTTNLQPYYNTIETMGSLRTPELAQRWSMATLQMLGHNLGRGSKKKLANALPDELAADLKRVFWLVHFRNKQKPAIEFQKEVARRAGVTDAQFAKIPITAVFHALKNMIDNDVRDAVADDLSPEISDLWKNA